MTSKHTAPHQLDHGTPSSAEEQQSEALPAEAQMPANSAQVRELRDVLDQSDTVLFVGSGTSLWSGLPSWLDLVNELAQFVESKGDNADLVRVEAARGELLQAASYGFDRLTSPQIGEFIRSACRYGTAKPHEIHRKIVSLGPRCFITTNYDNLIEEALRRWQPNRFFRPPITCRHLTETAEIVQARAVDFVFKPHGDAGDTDSIILTREQYRQLLPQGERHSVLESLKTLMVSRPVVYLGFGLADPDFTYVKDLLINTYKGGTRQHYAIMGDVSEPKRDYWRRNYGIHLVSYPIRTGPDGTQDHAGLLTLLDSLLEHGTAGPRTDSSGSGAKSFEPDRVLSLARHAAHLSRAPKVEPEFTIRVSVARRDLPRVDRLDRRPIDEFLDTGPERAILLGMPGAGKTYALKRAAARLAERLHEACLAEPFNEEAVVIPILADLKLYRGNVTELVNANLPNGLQFDELTRRFKCKIFLDSFNEMPREQLESGYESDFAAFVGSIGSASLVIGSRTGDGLDGLDLPAYCLDQLDAAVVEDELARLGIEVTDRFADEIHHLLRKPFYFHFVASGKADLPKDPRPSDLYSSFFANLQSAFTARFSTNFKLSDALSCAAYDAMNLGEEAYPLSLLLRILRDTAMRAGFGDLDERDVAHWLVSSDLLIPYSGGRVAFVHQSVTEYLAAQELAHRYQIAPHALQNKLSLTRWDQSLFLALSLLPPSHASSFLQDIVEADLELALSAAKYVEQGRDELISELLAQIPERLDARRREWGGGVAELIRNVLPLSPSHEPQLRELMKEGGVLGAAAVNRLAKIRKADLKNELFESLVESRNDYNYCVQGVGRALTPMVTPADVPTLVALAESVEGEANSDSSDAKTLVRGVTECLSELDLSAVTSALLPEQTGSAISKTSGRILSALLDRRDTSEALELAAELLLRGVDEAASAIYFIVSNAKQIDESSFALINEHHINRLISIAEGPHEHSYGLRALRSLCRAHPATADAVRLRAQQSSGLEKARLVYCTSAADDGEVFKILAELTTTNADQVGSIPRFLLWGMDLDWHGRGALFTQLLKLRHRDLALALMETMPRSGASLGLDLGDVAWWLQWMQDELDAGGGDWFAYRLSVLLSAYLGGETRRSFVDEFNRESSKFRAVLAHWVLPEQPELSTDDFSDEAISFLLADLGQPEVSFLSSFRGGLLGATATERFVEERLLPLLPRASGPQLTDLRTVLERAGSRHGRRYLVE